MNDNDNITKTLHNKCYSNIKNNDSTIKKLWYSSYFILGYVSTTILDSDACFQVVEMSSIELEKFNKQNS